MSEPEPLLTVKDVAKILSVCPDTVDNYCKEGKITFIRLKAGKRFDPADVQHFIDSRKFNHHL